MYYSIMIHHSAEPIICSILRCLIFILPIINMIILDMCSNASIFAYHFKIQNVAYHKHFYLYPTEIVYRAVLKVCIWKVLKLAEELAGRLKCVQACFYVHFYFYIIQLFSQQIKRGKLIPFEYWIQFFIECNIGLSSVFPAS